MIQLKYKIFVLVLMCIALTGCKSMDFTEAITCPHYSADPVYAYKDSGNDTYVVVFPDKHYDQVSDVSCVVSPSSKPIYNSKRK